MDSLPKAFVEALRGLNIEDKYHDVLAELTSSSAEFLHDIVEDDLKGCPDASGTAITAVIARGLVRKLASFEGSQEAKNDDVDGKVEAPAPSASAALADLTQAPCTVALLRGPASSAVGADASLICCGLRGKVPDSGEGRHKVLSVVLDRSGSMAGALWRRVVDAVVGVVTDDLLQNNRITLVFVVYSDDAREVRLPGTSAELRDLLLSRDYAPRGGTCFRAAFELTQTAVARELRKLNASGVASKDVDLATLLFTDGEDTSVKGPVGQYGVPLVDQEASLTAARNAGDVFRQHLRDTGCTSYTCIAAFGVNHNPDQCQYLSDRYFFINRGEVLSEVLAGGLGALLSSAGQCSVRLHLPAGVSLEEPLPETLPLDAEGQLDHHIWIRRSGAAGPGFVVADLSVAGEVVAQGKARVELAALAEEGSYEGHRFLVDLMALQLRRIARELCGKKQLSADELAALRQRLTNAKDRVQPTRDAAHSAKGAVRGRAALRERVAEVEAARERLSYALGQFDENDVNDQRKIGSVAIDAILRDAGQHIPQGPGAAALARRAEAAARLAAPEPLSKHGQDYSTDAYSCCDASELAKLGDAQFFQLANVRVAPDGGFLAAEDGTGLVSREAFVLLSQGGAQAVKFADSDAGFTHCGIPLFATAGHFERVLLHLPEALQAITPTGVYTAGTSERQLVSLLGRAAAAGPAKTEAQVAALLHKARAVHAVLAVTAALGADGAGSGAPCSLLEKVCGEVAAFIDDKASRAACPDMFAIAGAGLLVSGLDADRLAALAAALVEESLRRRLSLKLHRAKDAQKLSLAWALLGPADADEAWLDLALPAAGAEDFEAHSGEGFDPLGAPDELDDLERSSPGRFAPRAAGAATLLSILSANSHDGAPNMSDLAVLRQLLPAWGRVAGDRGGVSALWQSLDALMTSDAAEHKDRFDGCVAALRVEAPATLRGTFDGAAPLVKAALQECVPGMDQGALRSEVAAKLRELVAKRKELVTKYALAGASFPALDEHSRESVAEIWGAPAEPVDRALHRRATLKVWRKTMKVGVSMTTKEALADKLYRKRGGRFEFPSSLDTFIRGLHRRTEDLHSDWTRRLHKPTAGAAARIEAVNEMLLRLRWDDRDDLARAKLSHIVARIWDGLEGEDLTDATPLTSALWLHDAGDVLPGCERGAAEAAAEAAANSPLEDAAEEALAQEDEGEEPKEAVAQQDEAKAGGEAAPPVAPAPPGLEDMGVGKGVGKGAGKSKGKGKGKGKGERAGRNEDGATASAAAQAAGQITDEQREGLRRQAQAKMDSDRSLRRALEKLSTEVRRQMETFATDAPAGQRMKLPVDLKPLERKAIHVWSDIKGLDHQSFAYRMRRRLHLVKPGVAAPPAQADADADGDFDWGAWDSEDDN